jgi:prevent-host-death family protein
VEESVSAAEANRKFSQILRGVREEQATYIVTSHGKPVAKIVPFESGETDRRVREAARDALLKRLESQALVKAKSWTRADLYEDED